MTSSTDEQPITPTLARSAMGLLVGMIISVLLSAALVYSAAKAGITPGVSPLVVLFGWVIFGSLMRGKLKGFLAIAQVTGSAGAAVTAGVVFTAPIIQIVYSEAGLPIPPVDVVTLIIASIAGSLMGFGFVGLGTKRFLSDPRLPAPEAVAADRLISTAVANPGARPKLSISLLPGLLGGFLVNAFLELKYLAHDAFHATIGAPWDMKDADGNVQSDATSQVELPLPVSPLYLGIGALLTLPTALLVFAGGLVNASTTSYAGAEGMPDTTFRWVGGAAMTIAVVYSLLAYVLEGRKRSANATRSATAPANDPLLEQSPGTRRMLFLSILLGAALLFVMMARIGAPPLVLTVIGIVALVLVSLLSGLGGLLSLQVGSSASPVSGTVFMGMLVLSITALGVGLTGIEGIVFLVPIVVAACVAICAANDSSQDYKTLQLNGFTVSCGFSGQLLGLLGGAIAVPIVLNIADVGAIASTGLGLGGPDLPAPQASFFGTVLSSLFLDADIPWPPIFAGAALGLIAVGIEIFGKARGMILSSLAFAVGIYLPSYIGTGMMLGAVARFLGTRKVSATTHEGILVAAGLITGDAFASLILGFLIYYGFSTVPYVAGGDGGSWVPSAPWGTGVAQIIFFALLALIFVNYLRKRNARQES
ncbi:MAG: OPT/YSL family transporter [Planctomycetota bacterium]|nr:OPT/YSL family transporter [Planctomycetota bacterium]